MVFKTRQRRLCREGRDGETTILDRDEVGHPTGVYRRESSGDVPLSLKVRDWSRQGVVSRAVRMVDVNVTTIPSVWRGTFDTQLGTTVSPRWGAVDVTIRSACRYRHLREHRLLHNGGTTIPLPWGPLVLI